MQDINGTTIKFSLGKDTKNNYVFEQDRDKENEKPAMYPLKIYLNKELFKTKPSGVVLSFKAE